MTKITTLNFSGHFEMSRVSFEYRFLGKKPSGFHRERKHD
jgi:hypothetical protein